MTELLNSTPLAVVGSEVTVTREQARTLNGQGAEQAKLALFTNIGNSIMAKHAEDVEVAPLDGQLFSSGRKYRLEIVTFSRAQWLAHTKEWDKLMARVRELEEILSITSEAAAEIAMDPHRGPNDEQH